MADLRVSLEAFHGPLDLLLHLVAQAEVDIHELPLAQIADQFVKHLEGGLSTLENAILDFEVVDAGLMLELDAVVVKRELLLWPLAIGDVRYAAGLAPHAGLAAWPPTEVAQLATPGVVRGTGRPGHGVSRFEA